MENLLIHQYEDAIKKVTELNEELEFKLTKEEIEAYVLVHGIMPMLEDIKNQLK